ncbi:CPK6, partial [Symbiodinium sp. KB8]
MEAVLRLAFKRCLHGNVKDASPEELKKAVDDLEEMLHIGEEWMENRKSLHDPSLRFEGWVCEQLSRTPREDPLTRHMELSWPEYLVSLGGVVRLHPDFDPEFFADQLAEFFEYFKTLSDDILAGNPVTAGQKLTNPKDQALMEFIKNIFEECDEDDGGTIDETEFENCFMREEVQKQLHDFSIPVSNLKTMFKTLDKDGEGKLSFEELSDGFLKLAAIMRSNDRAIGYLNKIFAEADEDQSGTLNKEEFSSIFQESSVQRKLEQLGIRGPDMEDLFGMIDEDGSGQVTLDEVIAAFIQLRDPNTAGERGAALLSKIFAE